MICAGKYEPDAKAPQTHTCDLDEGHAGLHHCPRCGKDWMTIKVDTNG